MTLLRPLMLLLTALATAAPLAVDAEPAVAQDHAHSHHHSAPAASPSRAHGGTHAHGMHEAQSPAPEVRVQIERDAMGGWNLRLATRHFRFSPERVNEPHEPGTGHAHIYVNGTKFARLYGPWFHLPALGAGRHTLRVSLNTNDHREYAHQGRPIEWSAVVEE